jgi:periplasmic protein TonB
MHFERLPRRLALAGLMTLTLWLAGCGTTGPGGTVPGQLSDAAPARNTPRPVPRASDAASPLDYRRDAAGHIYARNKDRIYGGKLPPMLYAIGTLEVRLDSQGRVQSMHWMRAPKHAPEVIQEIERTVLDASPFPAATRLGRVTWTDTWLWDKGGHFQLDTLTEGQL